MISPKYSSTHYFHTAKTLRSAKVPTSPHIVNLYLDYNCPFSAKLFLKLNSSVISKLQDKHPYQFQFVFVNVVQPWHPNSVLLTEYALVFAKLLSSKSIEGSNEIFWKLSQIIFENKEEFYDTATYDLPRNSVYKKINELVFSKLKSAPFSKDEVYEDLEIKESNPPHNTGNGATEDVKYFTKYLRGVGVHVTPTVSVDGIVNNNVSSGSEIDELVKVFEASL